jgi:hemerythrin
MLFFEWTDELSIGVEQIDNQHKKLVSIVNDFHENVDKDSGETAVRKTLKDLVHYVQTHFADEEKVMEKYNYPQLEFHRRMHEGLTDSVFKYVEKLQIGQKIINLDMAIFLKGWLENHIAETDKKIGIFIDEQNK